MDVTRFVNRKHVDAGIGQSVDVMGRFDRDEERTGLRLPLET